MKEASKESWFKRFGLEQYSDPEAFRDELGRYGGEGLGELFWVNREIFEAMCNLTDHGYLDLSFESKVITSYGNQEDVEAGYNPWKSGRKSDHLKFM